MTLDNLLKDIEKLKKEASSAFLYKENLQKIIDRYGEYIKKEDPFFYCRIRRLIGNLGDCPERAPK